jgi:hypothetical protein
VGLKLNEWEWTKRCGGVRWAPCELVALLEEGEKNEKFLAWGEGLDLIGQETQEEKLSVSDDPAFSFGMGSSSWDSNMG